MAGDLPLFDPFKALEEIRRAAAQASANEPSQELPQELPQRPAEAIREIDHGVNPTSAASAASAASAGGQAHHAPPARTNKEEERKKKSIKSYTYARGDGSGGGAGECGRDGAAEAAEAAEISLTSYGQKEFGSFAAAEVSGDGLRKWRSALAGLSSERAPCPGYRLDEWPRTLARALHFLDTFGSQAEALGWTAARLFGVHREIGIVRVDACGALVLPGSGPVRAITATEIRFGHLTYREKPGQPQGVPWWEFGR